MNGGTLTCMSMLVHNEDDRSSVGVSNATSHNNRVLFHQVVINILNVDEMIHHFNGILAAPVIPPFVP